MEYKICSKCNINKPISDFYTHKRDGYSYWCKSCTGEHALALTQTGYWKQYYQKNRDRINKSHRKYAQKEYVKKRHQAMRRINWLIESGKIRREPCLICGDIKTEAHHSDYAKPEDVIWLCRKHHLYLHGKEVNHNA